MASWFRSVGQSTNNQHSQSNHGQSSSGAQQFTVQRLQELYATLYKYQDLSSSSMASANGQATLIETIRAIAEVIVYGDQHTEQLFDYFCEKNMLPLFLGLLDQPNCSMPLQVQIIQSVSILVQNIRSEISLYYTLSNNHVNRLISHSFDFTNEEVLGHYISFLKTLSLRLNQNTIQFFFNDRLHTFPLFEEAIKFFDHSEGMVRTAVRTITLNVFRVNDPAMVKFLVQGPAIHYIEKVVRYIHQRCRRLHLLLLRAGLPEQDKRLPFKLEVALTEQQDHMLYLEDILNLDIDGMQGIVVDSTMAYLFLPLLMASLMPSTFPFSELDDMDASDFRQAGLTKEDIDLDQHGATESSGSLLGLFLLAHALFVFSNSKMVTRIAEAIFLPVPVFIPESNADDATSAAAVTNGDVSPRSMSPLPDAQAEFGEDELSDETDGAGSVLDAPQTSGAKDNQQVGGPKPIPSAKNTSFQQRVRKEGNPIGFALIQFLCHDNERHCLAAASVLYALIHNASLDESLLVQVGLGVQLRALNSSSEFEAASFSSTPTSEKSNPPTPRENAATDPEKTAQLDDSGIVETDIPDKEEPDADDATEKSSGALSQYIVHILLQLLARDPPVSTLCQRVVAKLAIDLAYDHGLDKKDLEVLTFAYMTSVERFRVQLESFETHEAARFIGLFEREWDSLCAGPLKVESLMTRPETLLPSHPSMPLDARQPYSGLEVTQSTIRSFMILRLLWVTLNNKPNSLLAHVGSSGSSTKENAPIDLSKGDYIKVNIYNPKGAQAPIQPAFLVLAGGALVLAQPEKAREQHVAKGIVRTVAPLQHVRFAVAQDDPLLMYFAVHSPTNQPIGWAHQQLAALRAASTPHSADVSQPDALNPRAQQGSPTSSKSVAEIAKLFPWADESANGPALARHASAGAFGVNRTKPNGSTWFFALRFSDHGTAYWAQDQLERAIEVTISAKIKRMHRLIEKQ